MVHVHPPNELMSFEHDRVGNGIGSIDRNGTELRPRTHEHQYGAKVQSDIMDRFWLPKDMHALGKLSLYGTSSSSS